MADNAGSAADMLLGNPDPTPPADGGAPPVPPTPPAPPADGGQGGDWHAAITNEELRNWAQTKGWKSPDAAIASYQQLEKLIGHEKIPVPKGPDDVEGWNRLFKAAGRPDAPDGYGLDKLEGADPEFAKGAASVFHEAGLSPQQASKLVEFYSKQSAAAVEAQEQAFAQQSQVEMGELRAEWGPAFEAKTEAARRAARQFGIDGEQLGKIEKAIGSKGVMDLLSRVGQGLLESPAHGLGGDRKPSGFMSPAEAGAELQRLQADGDWSKRVYSGDQTAVAERNRLLKIQAGISG